ncbi:MAG: sulfite exporter TauE/SafE family protein [Desulfosporosinus sp.]|nr:sulfite exporter TauE/SafE family protein [Desulfosporosinus sp.]
MTLTMTVVAAIIVFVLTTLLAMVGIGAAFIIIPAYIWLGVALPEATAIALLLNGISMTFAAATNAKHKLIDFKIAIPIAIVASLLTPFGAYATQFISKNMLLWFFSAFLVFAASMMIFYKTKQKDRIPNIRRDITLGSIVGAVAGFLSGLLGIGGGNFILPTLVGSGMEPKKASGTTSFVVAIPSLVGFLAKLKVANGHLNWTLLGFSVFASISGALLGASLMNAKMKSSQLKVVIGIVLYAVAIKMILGLI